MIQRIQSIYIVLSILIGALLGWIGFKTSWENPYNIVYLSVFLQLIALFSFKNRRRQIGLLVIGIVLNLLLIVLLVNREPDLLGGLKNPEKSVELLAGLLSVILLFMAIRGIKKDEKLVKSVDRFR